MSRTQTPPGFAPDSINRSHSNTCVSALHHFLIHILPSNPPADHPVGPFFLRSRRTNEQHRLMLDKQLEHTVDDFCRDQVKVVAQMRRLDAPRVLAGKSSPHLRQQDPPANRREVLHSRILYSPPCDDGVGFS